MIRVRNEANCCTITLARAEKANALTEEMLESLALAASDAAASAKVLILTGEGKVFSAGADLDGMKNGLGLSPADFEQCGGDHRLGRAVGIEQPHGGER